MNEQQTITATIEEEQISIATTPTTAIPADVITQSLLEAATITTIKQEASYPTCVASITNFIKSHGYPVEIHNATTKDDFTLTMFRIPHGCLRSLKLHNSEQISDAELNKRKQKKRPVVFLQHGCFNSSSTWVVCGPSQSLGFILADAGFVWCQKFANM